jgi:hypothetical protein
MFDDSSDENESEYSFVHPYGDKRCNIKSHTILDRLATNLKDVQHFGHAVRIHIDHTIKQIIEEDYVSDSSNDGISKSKTINSMFDKATGCAENLRYVAGEIGDCGVALATNEENSYDDRKLRRRQKIPSPIKVPYEKKVSDARVHDGFLTDDFTDSDEYYSDEDSSSGSESSSSYSSSSDEDTKRHLSHAKLRRKKQQFLQRRALERAAAESDDSDEEESFDSNNRAPSQAKGRSYLTIHHSQEMRPKNDSGASKCSLAPSDSELEAETSTNTASDGIYPPNDTSACLRRLQWESKDAMIVVSGDQVRDFLTSSHIGPVITRLECSPFSEVFQLGDVIIRVNGMDVSTMEGEFVSEMLMKSEGKSIRVTYLRKAMLV